MQIAEPLQNAIDELSKLPSIGRKTAQRLALFLLKSDKKYVEDLSKSLLDLKEKIRECKICGNISVEEVCDICNSPKRDKTTVCVVEESSDVIAIEKTNEYSGLFHVLGGVLSPLLGKGVDDLNIKQLFERIADSSINEVILALNPDTEGETTTLYLAKSLKEQFPHLKITRIARGIPIGGDLEFSDDATIGRAVLSRIIL
ncbi:MAG: recombination mediator RecR [Melioribacteraceae bacterium]|nr:recombination mediator RecR [Melioribacteraceae bacterium]MCO6474410.1 recombination protein RecR [Melioribacteraceae bacterium]